jgi:hypothetical protein
MIWESFGGSYYQYTNRLAASNLTRLFAVYVDALRTVGKDFLLLLVGRGRSDQVSYRV